MIRIICIDDHEVLREGLLAIIGTQADMRVVAEGGDGQAAIELFRKHQPDVALMDLRLPVISGSEAIAAIRREWPKARVLVLTTYDGIEDVQRAMRAGARGYVLKDALRTQLLDAIRAVHAGSTFVSPAVAQRLAEAFSHTELTSREREILSCIVSGYSNKAIAATLSLSEGTVRIHVSHVLGKLGVADRTQAAVAAIERGIVHLDRLPEP